MFLLTLWTELQLCNTKIRISPNGELIWSHIGVGKRFLIGKDFPTHLIGSQLNKLSKNGRISNKLEPRNKNKWIRKWLQYKRKWSRMKEFSMA